MNVSIVKVYYGHLRGKGGAFSWLNPTWLKRNTNKA